MSNGSGISRGDRNRNARLSGLRSAVPVSHAIVGIDLADRKQMVVVTDHDSKVLARRTFRVKAWDLGAALDWSAERAARAGFAGVTVACEPTGHRWRVLAQLADQRGMSLVCATRGVGVGPPVRGPDPGQDRRQGCGADRPPGRRAALLPARTGG